MTWRPRAACSVLLFLCCCSAPCWAAELSGSWDPTAEPSTELLMIFERQRQLIGEQQLLLTSSEAKSAELGASVERSQSQADLIASELERSKQISTAQESELARLSALLATQSAEITRLLQRSTELTTRLTDSERTSTRLEARLAASEQTSVELAQLQQNSTTSLDAAQRSLASYRATRWIDQVVAGVVGVLIGFLASLVLG